jgi:hypothetical protein
MLTLSFTLLAAVSISSLLLRALRLGSSQSGGRIEGAMRVCLVLLLSLMHGSMAISQLASNIS